jgi:hypothetical protein
MAQRTGTALELKFVYALKTISTRGNVTCILTCWYDITEICQDEC